ncbi:AzlC family ABC transporter permease [Acetonema longum]|uniref:Putative branched-chain amino acid transport protein AzlC n=1 Tax=Acetonema longum DSM 6540 TaxID=1009370 RepID=F7NF33_9FIRM|nr:AzlC family ABC transporter permease [Acetonema longum]EGO65288.1 putative branched-chain amino acid transport protein AzlC [Acetonema longum DSM 6540]
MNQTASIASVTSLSAEYWQGVRDGLPVVLGVAPFGLICGVMGLTAGLTGIETLLMSLLVFAGASQFIGIAMIGGGAAWGIIIFTTLLVNLRHLLMGASLAKYLLPLSKTWQSVLSFILTDESYALVQDRIAKAGYSPWYQLGVSSVLYAAWAVATVAGVLAGQYIPDPLAWGLDFAMPATFLGMLVPRLADRNSLIVFLAAAAAAVAGVLYLPGKWYIILTCLVAGVTGGLLTGGEQDAD